MVMNLEFAVFRCAREWNDVTYVLHTRNEENQALEAQTEAGVRA